MPETPEKADVGLLGVVTVPPAPEMIVQAPVPMLGAFPANVVDEAQSTWSGPAFETVGLAVKVINTSSAVAAHGAFEIVQRNV